MNNLKKNYEAACDAYLKAFCKKHGYDYNDAYWIGDDVGGIVDVCDYCVDMATIRTDIDRDAPKDEFLKWYDHTLRLTSINHTIPTPNFDNWLRGCPRKSDEEIQELERLHERVNEANAALYDAIESEKLNDNE